MTNLNAPGVVRQPVSVTRKMSASLPRLRKVAPRVSRPAASLVARMMAPEPDKRFATCADVIAAIDAVLASERR